MSRVITPTVLQMEATECGAAALGAILAYYECYLSLAYLREACDVSRDGSKAINIIKAARSLGMEAEAYQVETIEDLLSLPTPSLLHWGFNHFVVFEGKEKELFYINDPAIGHRSLDEKTMSDFFTGVVLTFKPGAEFKKQGEPSQWVASILRRLKHSRDTLYFCFWLGLALVVPGILIPGFSRIFIDDILVRETQSWLLPFLVAMGMTAVFRGLFTYIQQSQLMKWQTQRFAVASMHFVWHLLQLPLGFFSQRYVGDIQERVSANERVAEWLSRGMTNNILEFTTFIFYALMMFAFSITLGGVGLLILGMNAALLWWMVKRIADLSFRALQQNARLLGLEVSGLNRIETIKSRGAEGSFFSRFAGAQASTLNAEHEVAMVSRGLQWLPKTLIGLANALMVAIGGLLVMRGQLTLGSLVAVQSLFTSMQTPLQNLINMAQTMPRIKGDFARIDDVLQYPEDQRYDMARQLEKPLYFQGDFSLTNVTFGYARLETPLFSNLNLGIKQGARISIVGASGSGKSTLAKLMAGLYQPWSGEISLDAHPLPLWDQKTYAHNIAYVEQENFLFSGTIKENLTYWDDQCSLEDIEYLLKKVKLWETVGARGGLNALVKEGGSNFSGGERQRLELVRALLRKPSLLILDEATSALNEDLEKAIFAEIVAHPVTLINIAHRLATVELTDEVIVLENGKIVQRGNPHDLLQTEGLYRCLYEAEAGRAE